MEGFAGLHARGARRRLEAPAAWALDRLGVDHVLWVPKRGLLRDLRRLATESPRRTAGPETSDRQQERGPALPSGLPPAPSAGPPLLFFSLRGAWGTHTAWETMLASALRLRGVPVRFVTCGRALPGCAITNVRQSPDPTCRVCDPYIRRALGTLGIPFDTIDALAAAEDPATRAAIERLDLDGCRAFSHRGFPLGEWCLFTVRWFLLRERLEDDPDALTHYRRFLRASVRILEAVERFLAAGPWRLVVTLNGKFFPERILLDRAKAHGLRVVTYEKGFLPDSLFFTDGGFASDYRLPRDLVASLDRPLAADEAERLDRYLASRRSSSEDGVGLVGWAGVAHDPAPVRAALGLGDRPLAAAFTNTTHDTASQGADRAFPAIRAWLERTIRWFAERPSLGLAVRIHPAESRPPDRASREPLAPWIRDRFASLPQNVRVVGPDETLSSYGLLGAARCALVYTSTIGLEAALEGLPAVVAGRAKYAGFGFTADAADPEAHDAFLARFAEREEPAPADWRDRARRFAHAFFFRAMTPIRAVDSRDPMEPRLRIRSLDDLAPGRDPDLDALCGFLLGAPAGAGGSGG